MQLRKGWFGLHLERVFPSFVWPEERGGGSKARSRICGPRVRWGPGTAGLEGILSLILRSHPLSSPHLSTWLGPVLTVPVILVSAFPLSPLVLALAQEVTHSETLGAGAPPFAPRAANLSRSQQRDRQVPTCPPEPSAVRARG